MQISYAIAEDNEFVHGYGQSYLANLGWNRDLVSRISDGRIRLGARIADEVVDVVEKLGLVHLDLEFIVQDVARVDQMMVKFHLYHWLCDSVATLDSVACLLNSHAKVIGDPRRVSMNSGFIERLSGKDPGLSSLAKGRYNWMKELKDMRDAIIHREGRLVVGGGQEPCVVLDFSRAFVKNIPLHRVRVPETNKTYTYRLDEFVESILKAAATW